MANPAKKERNKELVLRREAGWTFRKLAGHYNIDVRAVFDIYYRDKNKYTLRDKENYPQVET